MIVVAASISTPRAERRAVPKPARTPAGGRAPYPAHGGES